MKTNNKFFKSIIYFTLVVLAFSFEKPPEPDPIPEEPVMPALTHTGANTFGCYIDFTSAETTGEQGSELFVANEGESVWSIPAISGSFDEDENILLLQGTRYLKGAYLDDIAIQVVDIDDEGDYRMFSEGAELKGYISSGSDNCHYYYDITNYGSLNITFLDKTKNIISGTFSMILINPNCSENEILKITDGRFDFQY
ncbi:MAG: hypothetical protein ACI8ZM_002897 [Crocinitomix sp.]|jgi:hypothetical protein